MSNDNKALEKETETSINIASLIASGNVDDLPELYKLILDNIEVATKEEISILLRAMGQPKLTARQIERRNIRRHLSASLSFANAPETDYDFKSTRQEIFKYAEQLTPQNKTEEDIKKLSDKASSEGTDAEHQLYKYVYRLLFKEQLRNLKQSSESA